jgi:hypothetical protein
MPLYTFLHNLPNVLLEIANKMGFKKKKYIYIYIYIDLDFKTTSIRLTALTMLGKLMGVTDISSQYNYIMNPYNIILDSKQCTSSRFIMKTFTMF